MSPTGTNEHHFIPSGDRIASVEFIVQERRNLLGFKVKRLVARLKTAFVYDGPIVEVKAPAGYITDGATVPCILWPILERFNPYLRAFIPHDILYDKRIGSKVMADLIMYHIMRNEGASFPLAGFAFLAVLCWPGNWWHWYRCANNIGVGYVKYEPGRTTR